MDDLSAVKTLAERNPPKKMRREMSAQAADKTLTFFEKIKNLKETDNFDVFKLYKEYNLFCLKNDSLYQL